MGRRLSTRRPPGLFSSQENGCLREREVLAQTDWACINTGSKRFAEDAR